MQQRIYWIDNLKGFILLLVCISHLGLFPEICDYLKGARMTTFFFLSGFLFSTRKHPTLSSYWKSKCHSLLIPYFTLSFLFALFPFSLKTDSIFAASWIHSLNLPLNVEKYINTYIISIIDIIQGYSFQQGTGPLWFVYTLFQVSIIFYIINKIPYKFIQFSCIIFSLFLGWYCNINSVILPLHLNTMFTSLFFFGLGQSYIYIEREKERKKETPIIYVTYTVLILLIIYTISYINGGYISLVNNELGSSFIIFLLYTTSGIFLFITIFKYISQKDCVVFGIFRNISRNALIILCVHLFYAVWFDELFHANFYYKLLLVIICTIISIPIFRCYLYKLIGKEKISIKESLSIK